MVGVVGPNGCGKSNIIDAVRWVLGESRASELRGESMHDVIFNGSDQRAPSARASVELIFDNSQQRLSGQWGTYNELSVRRTLAREEGSRYFINNQQVRRRDIYDIFLGTGLGARGYAIIGQGMINRLIEARPEELRVYLEEAAGVSRYKERRRETENRLRDTHENLTRLEDLLQEIEGQLKRLEKQAAQAQRYQELQALGLRSQHALWRLEQQQASQDQQAQQQQLQDLELGVQQRVTQLRAIQARLEEQRVQFHEAEQAVQEAQAALYEANTVVSTAQAEVRYVEASQQRSVQRRQQIEQQLAHWQEQQTQAQGQEESLHSELEQAQLQHEEASGQLEHAEIELADNEEELQALNAGREEHRALLHRKEQRLALLQQRQQDSDREQKDLQNRQAQLQAQRDEQTPEPVDKEQDLEYLLAVIQHTQSQLDKLQTQITTVEAQQPALQNAVQDAEQQWHEQQKQETALKERINALQEIQAQWASPTAQPQWLTQHHLQALQQSWPALQVEKGWETALEAILREQIGAYLLPEGSTTAVSEQLQSIDLQPPLRVRLCWPSHNKPAATQPWQGCTPLMARVSSQQPKVQSLLRAVLRDIWIIEDWQQGLELAAQLPAGGRLVHPLGHILSGQGLSLYAPHDDQAGALGRQQELQRLERAVQAERLHAEQSAVALQSQVSQLKEAQQQLQEMRQRRHELSDYMHQLELKKTRVEQQKQQHAQRQAYLDTEYQRVHEQLAALEQQQEQRALELEELDAIVEEVRMQFVTMDERCVDLGETVNQLRLQLRQYEQAVHECRQKESTYQERLRALQQTEHQATEQITVLENELGQLQTELISLDPETMRVELEEALRQRQLQEERWQQAQGRLKSQQESLQELEAQEKDYAQGVGPLREKINELQLKEQEKRLRAEQFTQQLQAHEVNIAELDEFLAQQSDNWQDKTWLNNEIKRIQRAVDAMGAVNLAALQELEATQEREHYLLAQQEDLLQAIETLESAIRKIARETRSLLRETFEQVNQHFGTLFPQLFGGGEAKLVMMGDEVLEAGVQVMARPPGKRNSTIALLSGGEKALTAIALVFAFFKLNPAPFCLLDEVDAPLDDANAERYASLVQGMSTETQFLFVTHNKITMHKAEQLVGVTMQEQGVSRIVSVDMQAAAELAEA